MPSTRAATSHNATSAVEMKKNAARRRSHKTATRSRRSNSSLPSLAMMIDEVESDVSVDNLAGADAQSSSEEEDEDDRSAEQPEVFAPSTELDDGQMAPKALKRNNRKRAAKNTRANETQWSGLTDEALNDLEMQRLMGLQYDMDGYSTRSGSPVSATSFSIKDDDDDDYNAVDNISTTSETEEDFEKEAEAMFEAEGEEMIAEDALIDWNRADTFFMDENVTANSLGAGVAEFHSPFGEGLFSTYRNNSPEYIRDRKIPESPLADWPSSTTESRQTTPFDISMVDPTDIRDVTGVQTPVTLPREDFDPETDSEDGHENRVVSTPRLTLTRQNSNETKSSSSNKRRIKKKNFCPVQTFKLDPSKAAISCTQKPGTGNFTFQFLHSVVIESVVSSQKAPLPSTDEILQTPDSISSNDVTAMQSFSCNHGTFSSKRPWVMSHEDLVSISRSRNWAEMILEDHGAHEWTREQAGEFLDFDLCDDDHEGAAKVLKENNKLVNESLSMNFGRNLYESLKSNHGDHRLSSNRRSYMSGCLSESFQDETLAEGLDKKGMRVFDISSDCPSPPQNSPVASTPRIIDLPGDDFQTGISPSKRRATTSESRNIESSSKRPRLDSSASG